MVTPGHTATETDLLRMPDDGWMHELVDGEIRRYSPGGCRHSLVCVALVTRLHAFVDERRLGYVLPSNTGFRLSSRNVRAPDVSFVSGDRLAELSDGFVPVAPDLAVEVLSTDDRPRYVLEKVGEYLQAGVRLVWVVDPKGQKAAVYRSLTAVRELKPGDSLDGEDVLPGFRCSLAEILK